MSEDEKGDKKQSGVQDSNIRYAPSFLSAPPQTVKLVEVDLSVRAPKGQKYPYIIETIADFLGQECFGKGSGTYDKIRYALRALET